MTFVELCDQFDATDAEKAELWTFLCFIRFREMLMCPAGPVAYYVHPERYRRKRDPEEPHTGPQAIRKDL